MFDLAPLSIGPVVLDGERALVAVALVAGLVVAEFIGRRRGHDVEWAWTAVVLGLLAARVGWVVAHPQAYLARPLEALFVWQGGFLAWAGVLVGVAWAWRRAARQGVPSSSLWSPIGVAAGATVLALVVLPVEPERPALSAMDVTVQRLEGSSEAVESWQGTPTVVNLWATWCPPCRRELPMLVEVAGDRTDVRLMLVSQGEPADLVAGYLADEDLPSSDVRLDPARALGTAIALSGYPTTLFIDADGVIQETTVGELSRARLLRGLAAVGVPARPAGAP